MSEKEETQKAPKKAQYREVKVIELRGASALVEYLERKKLARKIVPVAELDRNRVELTVLKAAQDYGDFFDVKLSAPSNAVILDEFHRLGIWTARDFLVKSAQAREALMRLYCVPALQILIDYSREVTK